MKKLYIAILAVLLFAGTNLFAQALIEVGTIPFPPATAPEGFGNFVAGMDMDGDGLPEIVAVDNNQTDGEPAGLIPTIYKYEWNDDNGWDLVWSAETNIPLQNTWPALLYGDTDNDGKGEVYWGPVNFLDPTNANPARVLVYESRGAGSDAMGVQSGENSLPNASWTIVNVNDFELRPFRWLLHDMDADGKQELIFCERAGVAVGTYKFGVISVSDIPDNGGGTETWTMEFSGLNSNVGAGNAYDLFILNNTAYVVFATVGDVVPFTYTGGAYTLGTTLPALLPGGSWKSAQVVDINNDGIKEAVVAGFTSVNQKIYLVQESLGTLTATVIADMSSLIGASGRLYGGTSGDLDSDGKVDFIFGTRGSAPDGIILRLEYAGGDITNPANYVTTIVDQEYAVGARWDEFAITNIDQDVDNELIYSTGYGANVPLIILDNTGKLPVELKSFSASVKGNGIILNWETATEINNRGFEIERSANGSNFVTVAFVNGRGTTNNPQSYSFADNNLLLGKYSYRLKQVDFDGTFKYSDVVEIDMNRPSEFSLNQNYPNPFNPNTTITFGLNEDANVKLAVYNLVGEEIALLVNESRTAGVYKVSFDASNLPSGTYIYRLEANGKSLMNKMILLK